MWSTGFLTRDRYIVLVFQFFGADRYITLDFGFFGE
jgi:hypothetical protein